MTRDGASLAATVLALRREFDASFAVAPAPDREAAEDILAVRVGGDPYALRLAEIAGLRRDWRVVPVPSAAPHLLGLAGVRGAIVPVYDLAGLLGYATRAPASWIVAVRGQAPASLVGLAFEGVEAHVRVGRAALSAPEGAGRVRGAVKIDGASRPLVHVPSVVAEIAREA